MYSFDVNTGITTMLTYLDTYDSHNKIVYDHYYGDTYEVLTGNLIEGVGWDE